MPNWKDVSWFAESAEDRTPGIIKLQLGGLKLVLARYITKHGKHKTFL